MQRMPYICDPKLIPRVQKYLEANVDKTYVDIGLMADELQNTYREYSRRKRNAFRASVKRAYSVVLKSYGLDDHNETSSEEELEDPESENSKEDRSHNNMMNNQMVELYTRPSLSTPKMNENELIDISSDDSKDESQLFDRSSNGPSTSVKTFKADLQNDSQNDKEACEKITVIQGKKRKIDQQNTLPANKKKRIDEVGTIQSEVPNVTFKDVVGIDNIIISINEDIISWMVSQSEKKPFRLGYLLNGPPGCGKTLLAHAIAGDNDLPLIKVAAPELVDGISGNSEKLIRELYKKAVASSPCVLFIDNIDAITSSRVNSQKDMQKRIVAQMNACLDELGSNPQGQKVILIGATCNPDSMDPSLRGYGRFSSEIRLGLPNEESRISILKLHSSHLNLAPNIDWSLVGAVTPGYVGGDLRDLILKVEKKSLSRFLKQNQEQIMLSSKNIEQHNDRENIDKDEADKNETEIIVDDDPKEVPKESSGNSKDENLVLVIEDENSKQEEEEISTSPLPAEIKSSESLSTQIEIETEIPKVVEPMEEKVLIQDWSLETITEMKAIVKRWGIPEQLNEVRLVTVEDFIEAANEIKPLSIREGIACVPKVCWDDVGSLKDLRGELMLTVMGAIKHRKQYDSLGLSVPAGVLLCGPPGCGKTLMAKALANEARLNFISVKGPELLNMYVGESEKAVRMCFERAKNSAPCIIFFDEIDALCPKRSSTGQSEVSSRVVAQLLTEMDGVNERKGVFILAATNRPDVVDPAVLRPGRFDKILYVGLPSPADRVEILKAITRNGVPRLGADVDLDSIGRSEKLSGYTGADLAALVKEAARNYILNNNLEDCDLTLTSQDFEKAISKMSPSVSEKDRVLYEEMKQEFAPRSQNEINEQMDLS